MQAFRNLKTMTKLLVSFGFLTALVVTVGVVAYRTIDYQRAEIDRLIGNDLPGVRAVADIDVDRVMAGREIRTAVIASGDEETSRYIDTAMEHTEAARKALDEALKAVIDPEIMAKLRELEGLLPQWTSDIRTIAETARRHDQAAGIKAIDQSAALTKRMDGLLNEIDRLETTSAEAAAVETAAAGAAAMRNLVILVVACAFASILLAFAVGRIIGRPLQQAVSVLEHVGERDLTVRLALDGKDEVGAMSRSLDTALDQMQSALSDVRDVSEGLAGAASQMAAAATDISSGAQEQASQLEETAASLEQITATVKASADNARQASQLAVGARETAERGGQVVEQAVSAMNEINHSSKRIADIITTIDEIAFQTNLLALNAAVEAARAGEQGRGFAVVAAEVRTLAQRSATAAKEIKGLIQDSVQKVESGSELVNRSGQTLQEIVSSVRRVADIVDEMSAAAREQSAGVDQVNTAVTQMDQVTQSSAAQTEEMSATAESLNDQATKLKALVGQFRLDGDGRRPSAARSATAPAKPARRPAPGKTAKRPATPARRAPVSVTIPTFARANGQSGSAAMDDFMSGTGDAGGGDGFLEA